MIWALSGAVVTKGVANVPWPGNPTPRIAETKSGMLNAIGLQNPGLDVFLERDLPKIRRFDTKIIVNVCGKTTEDYCDAVERLSDADVDMLEINVSCPNVKEGGIAFGQKPEALEAITKAVKKYAKKPVIMKLSPNVTDITEMARAAEAGGADVLSLINTITGMKIDINRRTFAIANKTGGMSGPGSKARGRAHGLPGGKRGEAADYRHGRHHERRRRHGVHPGRSHRRIRGNRQFRQSLRGKRDRRGHSGLHEEVSGGRYQRADRRSSLEIISGENITDCNYNPQKHWTIPVLFVILKNDIF